MSSTQKIFTIILVLSTVASIAMISYVTYLYFAAFKVMNLLNITIESIVVNPSDSTYVSIETVFLVENPTEYTIKLTYLKAELFLVDVSKGGTLYCVGENYKRMYSNPLDLPQFSNATTMIKINNVPVEKVAGQSSKTWFAKIDPIIIRDVPYLGRATLTGHSALFHGG